MKLTEWLKFRGLAGSGTSTEYLSGTGVFSTPAGGFTPTDYIAGLVVTKYASGNTIDVSAGSAYVPGSSSVVSYAGATNVSVGTLGNSQWNQVFLHTDGSIEVTNNASPPSTAYFGTARKGGTGGEKRWIGCFRTDGSANIIAYQALEIAGSGMLISPKAATNAAPYRVLTAGSSTSFAAVDMTTAVPRYACSEALFVMTMHFGSSAGVFSSYLSTDGTNNNGCSACTYTDTNYWNPSAWSAIDPSSPQVYYKISTSGGSSPELYLDVWTYKYNR